MPMKPDTDTSIHRRVRVATSDDTAVVGVDVVRVAANGTHIGGETNRQGLYEYTEPYSGSVTILAAGAGWNGSVCIVEPHAWTDPLLLTIDSLPRGGSVIFVEGTGDLPGLEGRLNPQRDSLGRRFIYGTNLSFEDSAYQPHPFTEGQPFSVADALGNELEVTVVSILGRTSLLRYRQIAGATLDAG